MLVFRDTPRGRKELRGENKKFRCILRSFCIFAKNSNYGENKSW